MAPSILPFSEPPSPDTWLLVQAYGNTVGAYWMRQVPWEGEQPELFTYILGEYSSYFSLAIFCSTDRISFGQ